MSKKGLERRDDRVNVLGVGVSSTSMSGVLEKIDGFLAKNDKMKLIVTVNPEFVMMAQDDPEFKKILNAADLAIADGIGLKLAGVKEIAPGRMVVEQLLQKGYKVFYLGSRVAGEMAEMFGGQYDDGHENIKLQMSNSQINDKIIKKINQYKPDILFVAYGAPWQEKWLFANSYRLKVKIGMGVGGAFDFLTGRVALPPEWVNKMGLEWLGRLFHEPWRWRRQLNLVRFVFLQIFSSRR